MTEGDVVSDLQAVGILSHVNPEHLEALKYYGIFGEFALGEEIIKQGQEQKRLYFIVNGKVDILLDYAGENICLGQLKGGDCFGELSVFEPGPASATVKVTETCVLWHLGVDDLQNFFDQLPEAAGMLMIGLCQILTHRLRLADEIIVEKSISPDTQSIRTQDISKPITAEALATKGPAKGNNIFRSIFKSD